MPLGRGVSALPDEGGRENQCVDALVVRPQVLDHAAAVYPFSFPERIAQLIPDSGPDMTEHQVDLALRGLAAK